MTAIVGIARGGDVLIAGDSAVSSNRTETSRVPKVMRGTTADVPWILGYAGYVRPAQLIRHAVTMPTPPVDLVHDIRSGKTIDVERAEKYVVTQVADAIREALASHGYAAEANGVRYTRTWMLFGFAGHLFTVGSDGSAFSPHGHVAAEGSGSDYALGVLHALAAQDWQDTRDMALRALRAAAAFQPGWVGPPFHIARLGTKEIEEVAG